MTIAQPPPTRRGGGPTEPASTIDEQPAGPVRSAERFRLGHGFRLVDRGSGGLQIGTDPPRRVILRNAPDRAFDVLLALDGRQPLHRVMESTGSDPELWSDVLLRLVDAGLIGRAANPAPVLGLIEERAHLTHRYGAETAEVLIGRRADAIVEIRGAGRIASSMALQLAASGVGHLHHAPDRPVNRHDLLPPMDPGRQEDQDRMAARLRTVSDRIRVSPVAGHQRPSIVVLAGDGPADATEAAALVDDDVPHLAVWAGAARAVIGPMVLPKLSSCLWCAELTRTEIDDGWPLVRQAMIGQPAAPSTVLAAGAAALAAAQVLDLLEGVHRPSTIDGTVEWDAAGLPRRRSWSTHPQCRCQQSAKA